MLSALLNSIQTTLGTRGFLVGNVFPVLTFTVVNGLLAAVTWPSFHKWIETIDTLTAQTLLVTALVAGIVVASYVLSALASAILETFEGRRWPLSWFRWVLHGVQLAKLRKLEAAYWTCVYGFSDVSEGIEGNQHASPLVASWIGRLEEARRDGQNHARTCKYPPTLWARWQWRLAQLMKRPGYGDVGVREMNAVRWRRDAGREIPPKVLQAAVDKLVPVLTMNAADGALDADAAAKALDRDCEYLIKAIYFSRNKYQAERLRLYNQRKFRFPVDADATEQQSSIVLAPTTMGNISRTMRSYAETNYGFDLDVLWTRLQNTLRTSEAYYNGLQDAKVQLDFFAACAWLAAATTIAWLAIELYVLRSVRGFVAIGVIGPLVTLAAYALACRAYSVFADIMRTGVDLFRFKVMTDLHLPLPLGLEEEKIAWQNLANVMGYHNLEGPGGTSISVTYKHS